MTVNQFTIIAKRILKTQKKLGALKGLKVTPLTISESRKRHLKQAGLYSVASLSAAAIAAAGITLAGKRKKRKTEAIANNKKIAKRKISKVKTQKGKVPGVKFPKLSRKDKIIGVSGAGAALALGTAAGSLFLAKRHTLLVEAKYAYGTKLFEVSSLSDEDLNNGVDKQILREITATVAQLKNRQAWAVKESASVEFLKMATAAEALVEEVMYAEMLEEEEALEEGYIFEDEEDYEDLSEGYIF